VAARLANEVGTNNVAITAHRLGITSQIQTDPSMALGAVEVSPLEMAEAYDAFANGGYRVHAYAIERIRTASGQVLYDRSVDHPAPQPVIGQPALSEMAEMLRQVVASGTGTRARIPGYDLAGKTGTTSDYRDAWFVGFTGGFVTAVWVGRDDNTPMKRVTAPAEIWRAFMAPSLPRLQAQAIPGGAPPAPPAPAPTDTIGNILDHGTPAPTPETPPDDPALAPPAAPPPRHVELSPPV
jgi:penicillin-binding protein 1A